MKKLLLSLGISLMLLQSTHAQEITGIVKKAQSGEPCPYSYVYYKESQVATMTNERGEFAIIDMPKDELVFRYRDYIVKEMPQAPTKGKPMVVLLTREESDTGASAMHISADSQEEYIGFAREEKSMMKEYAQFGSIVAAYITVNKESYVKKVILNLSVKKKNNHKIRLRIFSPPFLGTAMPSEDLLQEDVIITPKKGENVIDIAQYKVPIDEDGIYVGIEWLITDKQSSLNAVSKDLSINLTGQASENASWRYFLAEDAWGSLKFLSPKVASSAYANQYNMMIGVIY